MPTCPPAEVITRFSAGIELLAVACKNSGCTDSTDPPSGNTSKLPSTTWLPLWFHSVNWLEIVGSWLINELICCGP